MKTRATWTPKKAKANFAKHGVRMAEGVAVLDDPQALTGIDYESDPSEERFVTLGLDAKARLLVVVYVVRENVPHLISVRKANRYEEKQY